MSDLCMPDTPAWPPPGWSGVHCDPCVNPDDPAHLEILDRAWRLAIDYISWATSYQYSGLEWSEKFRPVVSCRHRRSDCCCNSTYRWLPLDHVTCYPIIRVESIHIGPSGCHPNGRTLREGEGFRLEWVGSSQRIALESISGCCGPWPSQDLCRPDGSPCTWTVELITGCDPPPVIYQGAIEFALQWAAECIQNRCTPANWTSKSFDGTTIQADSARPSSSSLAILNERLESYKAVVREWAFHGDATTWHRITKPVFIGRPGG